VNNYHKDLLIEILSDWDEDQLHDYIALQEERLEYTRSLVRELKALQKKWNKKKQKPLDTGARDGR